MKHLLGLMLLIVAAGSVRAQSDIASAYELAEEQNAAWLERVKTADNDLQLTLIKSRLIQNRHKADPTHGKVPFLVINGVPQPDSVSEELRQFLRTALSPGKVTVEVVDHAPEALYVNNTFPGSVVITITDKKTSRRLKRLF